MIRKNLLRPQVLLLSLFACVLAISFTNCGPGFTASDEFGLGSLGSLTKCEVQLYSVFSTQIHGLTSKNCAGCHNVNGSSNVFFAQANKVSAFKQFMLPGFDKFKSYATNPGHVFGVTGTPEALAVVTNAETMWAKAERTSACKDEGSGSGEFAVVTTQKVMTATATDKTIVFNLGSEVSEGSTFAGATLQVNVKVITPPGSVPTYYVSKPVLKTGTQGLTIQNISVSFNGVDFIEGTTFHAVDAYVAENQTANTSLSPNTLLAQLAQINPAVDTISLRVGTLVVGNVAGGTGGGGGGGGGGPIDGALLYTQRCQGCHGVLATSEKRGSAADRIQSAIGTVGAMRTATLQALSGAQIEAIAAALR